MSAVLSSDVEAGLEELETAFPGRVHHVPDGTGGAVVTVDGVELGERWLQPAAALSFELAYNYPAAAIYPFYAPDDIQLSDGSWPAGLQQASWRGQAVIQISLRHNSWNPGLDNAVGSVLQVQDWLGRL